MGREKSFLRGSKPIHLCFPIVRKLEKESITRHGADLRVKVRVP